MTQFRQHAVGTNALCATYPSSTAEFRLSSLWKYDIPFYQTCCVGKLQTATDVPLFKLWRDFASKKWKEAQKQIPLTISSKIKILQFYIMLNTVFVCEVFTFDVLLYFLCDLIVNHIMSLAGICPRLLRQFIVLRKFSIIRPLFGPFTLDIRDSILLSCRLLIDTYYQHNQE